MGSYTQMSDNPRQSTTRPFRDVRGLYRLPMPLALTTLRDRNGARCSSEKDVAAGVAGCTREKHDALFFPALLWTRR
jgi:hypothetical protein